MKVVVLAMAVVLTGCQFDPFGGQYTQSRPTESALVGNYRQTSDTFQFVQQEGRYPAADSSIILRSNGTFELINVPDWWLTDFGQPRGGFDSGKGRWILINLSGSWQIELEVETTKDFASRDHEPRGLVTYLSLIGESAPYKLHLTVGDPDMGDAMQYEKVSSDHAI